MTLTRDKSLLRRIKISAGLSAVLAVLLVACPPAVLAAEKAPLDDS